MQSERGQLRMEIVRILVMCAIILIGCVAVTTIGQTNQGAAVWSGPKAGINLDHNGLRRRRRDPRKVHRVVAQSSLARTGMDECPREYGELHFDPARSGHVFAEEDRRRPAL